MTRNRGPKQREALAQEGQVAGEVGPMVVVDDTYVGAKTINFSEKRLPIFRSLLDTVTVLPHPAISLLYHHE